MKEEVINKLEELFVRFFHSANGKTNKRSLFAHVEEGQHTREEDMYADDRAPTQLELESYFTETIKDGEWDEYFKTHHFWRSIKYPKLVVMRDWANKIKYS